MSRAGYVSGGLEGGGGWRGAHLQVTFPREAPKCTEGPKLLELLFEVLTRMEFWLLKATILPLWNGGKLFEKRLVQVAHRPPVHTTHERPSHREAHFRNVSQPTLPDRIILIFDQWAHDHRTASR